MIEAKIILDSITEAGDRLTTMEICFHRYVLAEFNTHRAFSRNSASSRAIPIEKQLAKIREDTAFPIEFGSNQSGMQAGPPLTGKELEHAMAAWGEARDSAVEHAEKMLALGVHKQVTNRLLEPFMWHTAIVSATDYKNFFGLRNNVLAQPEIHELARLMVDAYDNSEPTLLQPDEWHTPYIHCAEDAEQWLAKGWFGNSLAEDLVPVLKKVSAARCGRVSYLTQDGKRDLEKDLELYDRLTSADPAHASPLEHVATPNAHNVQPLVNCPLRLPKVGNFVGWTQLRHENTRYLLDSERDYE